MEDHEALSYCGIYCGRCKNYKKNANCQGCRNEKSLVNDCPTRACAIGKGLLHCGECGEFPCATLEEFYSDGVPHHVTALENMRRIVEIGPERWLLEQEKS
jgi:hypothetical protein